jgi:hypothetical protein
LRRFSRNSPFSKRGGSEADGVFAEGEIAGQARNDEGRAEPDTIADQARNDELEIPLFLKGVAD